MHIIAFLVSPHGREVVAEIRRTLNEIKEVQSDRAKRMQKIKSLDEPVNQILACDGIPNKDKLIADWDLTKSGTTPLADFVVSLERIIGPSDAKRDAKDAKDAKGDRENTGPVNLTELFSRANAGDADAIFEVSKQMNAVITELAGCKDKTPELQKPVFQKLTPFFNAYFPFIGKVSSNSVRRYWRILNTEPRNEVYTVEEFLRLFALHMKKQKHQFGSEDVRVILHEKSGLEIVEDISQYVSATHEASAGPAPAPQFCPTPLAEFQMSQPRFSAHAGAGPHAASVDDRNYQIAEELTVLFRETQRLLEDIKDKPRSVQELAFGVLDKSIQHLCKLSVFAPLKDYWNCLITNQPGYTVHGVIDSMNLCIRAIIDFPGQALGALRGPAHYGSPFGGGAAAALVPAAAGAAAAAAPGPAAAAAADPAVLQQQLCEQLALGNEDAARRILELMDQMPQNRRG